MDGRFASIVCCMAVAACSQATLLSRFQYTPSADILRGDRVGPLSYSLWHSFRKLPDGENPEAGLIGAGSGGTYYGTTYKGGAHTSGTVFTVTPGGGEKVLHSFGKGTDGSFPAAGLVDVAGTFYGTTSFGGTYPSGGLGTVFSVTTGGAEKVLHSFGMGQDGSTPMARVIDVGGTLYGTTYYGGSYPCGSDVACGTVFSITTSGTEKVLHSFGKGSDGANPCAGLVDVKGILYGTTAGGGTFGEGTVFSITTGGKESVLYSFGTAINDGSNPCSDLVEVGGVLYGTTAYGGAYSCPVASSCGTVFSITTSGVESVLHSFGKGTDGKYPMAGLIAVKDSSGSRRLYGTTEAGGMYTCSSSFPYTCGTLFSITTGGTERVLHSFGNALDGFTPVAGLNYKDGHLVGTTEYGGAHGYGTVFSFY